MARFSVKVSLSACLFLAASMLTPSCVYDDLSHPVDCATIVLQVTVDELINASVCGAHDGSVSLHATGGAEPYQFSIGDSPAQPSGIFNELSSGLYAVTVVDTNGCQTVYQPVLISVDQFSVSFATTPDTDCCTGNGPVEITVNETTGPYRFALDDQAFQTANVFEGLKQGSHFLTIEDNAGCGVRTSFTIPHGTTGVSWQQDILPIFTASCAITGCHNGISRKNDWRIYAQVKENAAVIRVKTQNKSMPFDSELPQAQIDLIACWIDDGALNN